MEKKRIEWLDVMKGILISFVILSHSYPADIYRRFFTPFFLTMFFWASGYTFSVKNSWKEFTATKWKRLGIPFLCLGLIRVFVQFGISGGVLLESISNFLKQRSCQGDEMWFVSCLITSSFIFYIIIRMGECINGKKKNVFIVFCTSVLLLLGMYDIRIEKIKFVWEFELACVMAFYLMLGYFAKKSDIDKKIRSEKYSCIIQGCIYLILTIGIKNRVDIHAEQFEYPLLWFVLSLLSIKPVIWISWKISEKKIGRYFIFLGKNTLFYYTFAGFVRIVFYSALEHINVRIDEYMIPVACMVLSQVILAFPAKFVNEKIPWIVGKNSCKTYHSRP